MINCPLIKVLLWNGLLYDLLEDLLPQLLGRDALTMLSADDNSVHPSRYHGTSVMLILHSNLGLGIRSQPRQSPIKSCILHRSIEFMCQEDGHGEILWGFVGGIAKHDALVASTKLLQSLIEVYALGDLWRLLFDSNQNIAGFIIKSFVRAVVSNVLDGRADDLLVVQVCLGGDLTENHNHTYFKLELIRINS